MKQVINCLKENNPVINKKLKEVTIEEGLEIAKVLFETLNKRKDGIGLAANQVGIDAAVAVVNVREPLILINPKVIEQWEEVDFYEGCLSYPKKGVHTKRYKNIIIKTEQIESNLYFSGAENPSDGKGSWEKEQQNKEDTELRTLEAVCVQHEIDHLNGVICMDREVKLKPIVSNKSFGRNEIVMITDGNETKDLKWKKAKPLIDSGEWELYIGGPIT
jgi:peptide deformylase|tara:strand:- start:205 stop:858 length:654 start_codon:yes stop_codon:yes gene_type:complete